MVLEHDNNIKLLKEIFNSFEEKNNHIFFEGQIYDGFSVLIDIFNKSKKEIIIIVIVLNSYKTLYVLCILCYNFNSVLEDIMKLTRTELREKIMIILYQIEIYRKENIEYDLEEVFHENLEIDNQYVRDIVNGVLDNLSKIDEIVNKYMDKWTIDRLGKTDASILRLATYEMLYYDTPALVVLNEAIELAKKYSDDKVVALVNAVLDKIRDNEEINGE